MESINLLKKSSGHLLHIISNNSIKRHFFSFLLISVFSFNSILKAQTVITGKIIDATSRQPLVAASIKEEGNNAHAALTDGRHPLVVAEARNVLACVGGSLDDELALARRVRHAVDGDLDRVGVRRWCVRLGDWLGGRHQ